MTEHALLTVLSVGVTIAIALITILIVSLRNWKKEFKEGNDKEHGEIWERVNNHGHKIECSVKDCKPRTAGVLLKEQGG